MEPIQYKKGTRQSVLVDHIFLDYVLPQNKICIVDSVLENIKKEVRNSNVLGQLYGSYVKSSNFDNSFLLVLGAYKLDDNRVLKPFKTGKSWLSCIGWYRSADNNPDFTSDDIHLHRTHFPDPKYFFMIVDGKGKAKCHSWSLKGLLYESFSIIPEKEIRDFMSQKYLE